MDLDKMRREYLQGGLSRSQLHDSPFEQFRLWYRQTTELDLCDPTAMVLATVDADGQPRQRTVLLKYLDERGLVFFTNYASAKAREIEQHTKVCLHFPWHAIERQVTVEGVAGKVGGQESAEYFRSRPRESQIAAWASRQSQLIASRELLQNRYELLKERFGENPVPVPEFWGGFRVVPHRFEFWQGRATRLHDRFEYRLTTEQQWEIDRLAP